MVVPAPAGVLDLDATVPLAFDAGWTMAVLFGFLRDNPDDGKFELPTENELDVPHRVTVELARLTGLLTNLAGALPPGSPPLDPGITDLEDAFTTPPVGTTPEEALRAALRVRNRAILTTLAGVSHDLSSAYQLGRSVRDTANPPTRGDRSDENLLKAVTAQTSRGRVAKLQDWLATLAPHFGGQTAAVVSASLGRWSDYCAMIFDERTPGQLRRSSPQKGELARQFCGDLLRQGDTWRNLLVGVESTMGLLTPEAYIAAGEAALSRTARIVKRIVLHYWVALFLLAVALAAITCSRFVTLAVRQRSGPRLEPSLAPSGSLPKASARRSGGSLRQLNGRFTNRKKSTRWLGRSTPCHRSS